MIDEQEPIPPQPRVAWLWRGLTVGLVAAGVAACLALRRQSLAPEVLDRDEEALRRACLGFPWPMPLRAARAHAFRDPATGTHTLSCRVPAGSGPEALYAYYEEYLARNGFSPRDQRGAGGFTRAYAHADGLRVASVAVHPEPVRGEYHTVVVSVRPAAGTAGARG